MNLFIKLSIIAFVFAVCGYGDCCYRYYQMKQIGTTKTVLKGEQNTPLNQSAAKFGDSLASGMVNMVSGLYARYYFFDVPYVFIPLILFIVWGSMGLTQEQKSQREPAAAAPTNGMRVFR